MFQHAFPWDYRAAELGTPFNATCHLIDFLAKYGIIFDRREATDAMVRTSNVFQTFLLMLILFSVPGEKSMSPHW